MLNRKGVQHMWAVFGLSCTSAQFVFSLIFSTKGTESHPSASLQLLYTGAASLSQLSNRCKQGKSDHPESSCSGGQQGKQPEECRPTSWRWFPHPLSPALTKLTLHAFPWSDFLQKHSGTLDDKWTIKPPFFHTPVSLLPLVASRLVADAGGVTNLWDLSVSGQQTPTRSRSSSCRIHHCITTRCIRWKGC